MFVPLQFIPGISGVLSEEEIEKCMEHSEITERLRRTLYYAKLPNTDRPSLPVTEIAVEFFQDAAPRELGSIDTFIASSYGRRACMSPCSMMLSMMYIERLKKRNPEYLNNVSSSDLYLISMMVASKYLYDEGIDEEVFNDEWAESANMDLEQVNELERNFLAAIEWSLFVRAEDFWRMLKEVEKRIAWNMSTQHGFSTYSDLHVLSQHPNMFHIILDLILELNKIMLVCSVAYMAGVFTMVASTASVMHVRQQLPHILEVTQLLPMDWPVDLHLLNPLHVGNELLLQVDPLQADPLLGEGVSTHADLLMQKAHQEKFATIEDKYGTNCSEISGPNDVPHDTQSGDVQKMPPSNKQTKGLRVRTTKKTRTSKEQGISSLHLPSLITIVMIKDTVLKFFSALQPSSTLESENDPSAKPLHDDDEKTELDLNTPDTANVVCTCGCCDGHSNYGVCYNRSFPLGKLTLLPTHKRLKRNLLFRNTQSSLNLIPNMLTDDGPNQGNCNMETTCQCCCGSSKRNPPLHMPVQLDTLVLGRIEEPFAGLSVGYSSTSAAAG